MSMTEEQLRALTPHLNRLGEMDALAELLKGADVIQLAVVRQPRAEGEQPQQVVISIPLNEPGDVPEQAVNLVCSVIDQIRAEARFQLRSAGMQNPEIRMPAMPMARKAKRK